MAAAVAAFTCGKACSAFSRWRGRTRSLTLTSLRLLAEIREQGHIGSMNLLVSRGWSLRGQHGGDQVVPLGGSTAGPHRRPEA